MELDRGQLAKIDDLFDQALDLPAAERADFLDRSCPDAEIRRRVERLLAAEQQVSVVDDPSSLLQSFRQATTHTWSEDSEAASVRSPDGGPEDLPPLIGPYRPTRVLGRGGMAIVYLAQRIDGHFEQSVALKLIPAGSDRQRVVRRFERERQILASLEHPSIARLFDGGITEDGRPFFAMEYVDGLPIDRHCDEHRLSVDERLRLFREVALAVHHAHRRLVLHRDLKPSNILVTGDGQVKLLDFGIATMLEPEGGQGSHTTSRWLTPDYASPEQVRAEPMSTASDVYQLGVLLYQLLTGRLPYRLTSSFAEAARLICEVEPTRPSQWFRTTLTDDAEPWSGPEMAKLRSTQQVKLYGRLRGDLDTIAMKCLHKEPTRRYISAERLAADIENHLGGLPVSAHPDSLLYRGRKFLGRHAKAVAAAALIAVLFGYNFLVVHRKNVEIAAERDKSRAEALKATAIRDYLVELFETAHPAVSLGEDLSVREVLDRGTPRLANAFRDQPLVRAEMQATTGELYRILGLFDQARSLLEQSLEGVRTRDPIAYVDYRAHLANVLVDQGQNEEAERLYRRCLVERRRLAPEDRLALARLEVEFGELLLLQSRIREAKESFESALVVLEPEHGDRHEDVAAALTGLAGVALEESDFEQAEKLARRSLEIRRDLHSADHPSLMFSLSLLGQVLTRLHRLDEAETVHREVAEKMSKVLGDHHPYLLNTFSYLAQTLRLKGETRAAADLQLRTLEIRRQRLDPSHPSIAVNLNDLGSVMRDLGDLEAAEAYLRQALDLFAEDDPSRRVCASNLASILRQSGRYQEAIGLISEILPTARRQLGPQHSNVVILLWELGLNHAALERPAEAQELLEEAAAVYDATLPPDHPLAARLDTYLAGILIDQGRLQDAERLLLASQPIIEKRYGESRHTARVDLGLGRILLARGELDDAEPLLRTAERILAPLGPRDAAVIHGALLELDARRPAS